MQAEQFFSFYHMMEEEKLEAAVVSMRGDALFWYQWEVQQGDIHNWREFKNLLLRHFRPRNQGGLVEQWAAVRQRGSVAEYCKEFIEKLSCLGRVPVDISLGIFINGLRGDIRSELRLMDPPNLKVALEWAEKIKEKDWAKASYGRHKEYSRNGPHYPRTYPKQITNTAHPQYNNPYPSPTPHQNSLTLPKNPPENLTKSIPLTDKELREKRARGLCFKCDEPWSFNHACKK